MVMRIVASGLAVLAAVTAVIVAANDGELNYGNPISRNAMVLLSSFFSIAGGAACLNHPKAATYLLGGAVLIFGISENWIPLILGVVAGAIEFHFGRAPEA
jgi:hypothetical protein